MSGRERAPNYTMDEKILLLNIIDDYKNIIECKKTDTVTWKDKENAWQQITNKFNAVSPSSVKRTKQSLQKFFENKKKEVRKSVAHQKMELLKTGGGENEIRSKDPSEDLILNIINIKSVTGLENPFDGDKNTLNENLSSCIDLDCLNSEEPNSSNYVMEENFINTNNTELVQDIVTSTPSTSGDLNWGNYKPSHLKTPVSQKLKCTTAAKRVDKWKDRRRPALTLPSSQLSQQYGDLAKVKLELAILQREAFVEDRKKRLEREEIEFNLKTKTQEVELEIKKQQLQKLMS